MKYHLIFGVVLLFCSSCQKYYVSVTRDSIGVKTLASGFANTPDPRREEPPKGERLLIAWNLFSEDFQKELVCSLSIIYKNYEEETINYEVDRKRDVISYFLLGEKYESTKGIMTYKVDIVTKSGIVVKSFKHQLYTKLIKLDES